MKNRTHHLALLLTLSLGLLAGCSTSSQAFVDDLSGFSVTRGRITHIENLSTSKVVPLTDGVAVTVSKPCRISITFEDAQTRTMELGPGVIVVHGYETDFVLKSELAGRPGR